jgi:hypothetical protein
MERNDRLTRVTTNDLPLLPAEADLGPPIPLHDSTCTIDREERIAGCFEDKSIVPLALGELGLESVPLDRMTARPGDEVTAQMAFEQEVLDPVGFANSGGVVFVYESAEEVATT